MFGTTFDLGEPEYTPPVKQGVQIDVKSVKEAYFNYMGHLLDKDFDSLRERDKAYVRYWKLIDQKLGYLSTLPNVRKIWGELEPKIPFVTQVCPHITLLTNDVILEAPVYRHGNQHANIFNLGQYIIAVPLNGSLQVHWIPVRSPRTWARHPHHKLSGRDTYTCFGSFHDYVEDAAQNGDFATLLRMMVDFLHIHNADSPLVELYEGSSIPHATLIRTEQRPYRQRHVPDSAST